MPRCCRAPAPSNRSIAQLRATVVARDTASGALTQSPIVFVNLSKGSQGHSVWNSWLQAIHGIGAELQVGAASGGFTIDPEDAPFSRFDVWSEDAVADYQHHSLKPLLGYVVGATLSACDGIIAALDAELGLPSAVTPGFTHYFRGEDNASLLRWLSAAQGEGVWWSDVQPDNEDRRTLEAEA